MTNDLAEKIKLRLEIVSKPSLDTEDMVQYAALCGWKIGPRRAQQIKKEVIKQFKGKVMFHPNLVSTEAFLNSVGTTREKEINCLLTTKQTLDKVV